MLRFFLTLLLLIPGLSYSQQGIDIYNKIIDHYSKLQYISLDFEIKQFQGKSSYSFGESVKGSIIKSNDKYYSRIGSVENLNAKPYSIEVDHQEKQIVFGPFIENINVLNIPELKSNVKKYQFSLNNKRSDVHTLAITVNQNDIKTLVLLYSPVTYDISKVVINMRMESEFGKEQMMDYRVEISYKNQKSSQSSKGNDVLDTGYFIRKKGGKVLAANRLKNYSILDLKTTQVR